jgi:hypothetical protein
MTHAESVLADVVYQTDPRWPWYVNRYGCRWRSIANIAELVAGQALTFSKLADLLDTCREHPKILTVNTSGGPYMMCGPDEHMIGNVAFDLLGAGYRLRQIGIMTPEGREILYAPVSWQYQIIHWQTAGPDGHYSVGDRAGAEIFDPWNNDELTPDLLSRMHLRSDYRMVKRDIRRRLLYRVWRI